MTGIFSWGNLSRNQNTLTEDLLSNPSIKQLIVFAYFLFTDTQQPGYGSKAPAQGVPPQGYGPPHQGYPPQQQPGYGPAQQQGSYGPPQQEGYAPPQQQPGYGPPQQQPPGYPPLQDQHQYDGALLQHQHQQRYGGAPNQQQVFIPLTGQLKGYGTLLVTHSCLSGWKR